MYVVVFNIKGKFWLSIDDKGEINASPSKEKLMRAFDDLLEHLTSKSVEHTLNASMIILKTLPKAVKMSNNALDLKPYVIDEQVITLRSKMCGDLEVVEVSEDIFDGREVIDIGKEVLLQAKKELIANS